MKVQNFKGWLIEQQATPTPGPVPTNMLAKGLDIIKGLISRGFTPKAAAALTGNMWQESKFNPAVTSKAAPYVGLVQWGSPGSRKEKLTAKPNWTSLETQLDYIKHEFDTIPKFKSMLPNIETVDIKDAAKKIATSYEGTSHAIPVRISSAEQLFKEWQQANPEAGPAFDPAQVDQPINDEAWGKPADSVNQAK